MDCQLVSDAIQRHGSFRVIAHVTRSNEIVSSCCKTRPDVVVISARLQDGVVAGLSALQDLRALNAGSRVVILLDSDERHVVVDAFLNGARGIFCKVASAEELRKCIRSIHKGEIWISNAQVEYIVDALMQTPGLRVVKAPGASLLSRREDEIARLVATGLSNLEVSEQLGLSRHTVKNYLFRIFEKLGISARIELVLYILSQARPSEAGHDLTLALAYENPPRILRDSSHRSVRRAEAKSATMFSPNHKLIS